MSRLASFRGPSTPSSTPVQLKQLSSPGALSRSLESTYHRKTRIILQELQSISQTWDDLVLIDGLKAVKSLIDTRTDLDNDIALLPDKQPRTRLVGPKLAVMEKNIEELNVVTKKLQKQFRRMNSAIENLEAILIEAHKAKGWRWVQEEPLWVTWSLEKFVTSISAILKPYHRSLNLHLEIVNILRKHSLSFEDSRMAMSKWVEQPWIRDSGWDARWEDICEIEVERWDK